MDRMHIETQVYEHLQIKFHHSSLILIEELSVLQLPLVSPIYWVNVTRILIHDFYILHFISNFYCLLIVFASAKMF